MWLTGMTLTFETDRAHEFEDVNLTAIALQVAAQGRPSVALGLLTPFLAAGLERRVGQPLTADERRLYYELGCFGAAPPEGFFLCSDCVCVSRSANPRARRCTTCSSSPRPTPELKSWHLAAWTERTFDASGEPCGWTIRYAGRCECGAQFRSADARQRHCENCRRPAGRTRRLRGSTSTRGRQRFRFAWLGETPLQGLSTTLPGGRAADLWVAPSGWLVETADAEAAKALQSFVNDGDLQRL